MNSKELRRKIKRQLKDVGRRNRQFVKMTCTKCKTVRHIRTNDRSIYTEDVIKNYVCIFCRKD